MYSGWGVKPAYRPPFFTFPSGAVIKTGHLKDDNAFTKYQGQEFQRMLIEELDQISKEENYLKLLGSCRSTVPELKPGIFNTTNPGGAGHGWISERFEVMSPNRVIWFSVKLPDGREIKRSRIFIPAKLEDNPILLKNDPGYAVTLEMIKAKDPDLYEAWRNGRWDIFAGQFFKIWRKETHVIRPFIPKKELMIIGGLDWGRTAPFSFHLAVVFPVTFEDPKTQVVYKFYRTITFFEVYGTDKTPSEWSREIKEEMYRYGLKVKNIRWVQADNAIFVPGQDKSISIADQFIADDEDWREVLKPGSKDRVGGWTNMLSWMSIAPDGLPYWLITSNNTALIKEIPGAAYDENNVEDLYAEFDHSLDEERYMLKALKWIDAKSVGIVNYANNRVKQQPTIQRPLMDIDLDLFASAKE